MNKFAVRRAIAALALAEDTIVALATELGAPPAGLSEVIDALRIDRQGLVEAATKAGLMVDAPEVEAA